MRMGWTNQSGLSIFEVRGTSISAYAPNPNQFIYSDDRQLQHLVIHRDVEMSWALVVSCFSAQVLCNCSPVNMQNRNSAIFQSYRCECQWANDVIGSDILWPRAHPEAYSVTMVASSFYSGKLIFGTGKAHTSKMSTAPDRVGEKVDRNSPQSETCVRERTFIFVRLLLFFYIVRSV